MKTTPTQPAVVAQLSIQAAKEETDVGEPMSPPTWSVLHSTVYLDDPDV